MLMGDSDSGSLPCASGGVHLHLHLRPLSFQVPSCSSRSPLRPPQLYPAFSLLSLSFSPPVALSRVFTL